MLFAEGIHKSFGDLKVLKGIDLSVREKEIVSIVGSSGAGKSTLLHILGTLDKPDSGSISYDEKPVTELNEEALAIKPLALFSSFTICFLSLQPWKTFAYRLLLGGFPGKKLKSRLKSCWI
jgi:lipoprotein-releasing system ATP-binding protein